MAPSDDVTRILAAIGEGNHAASAELLPLVYDELRRLAADRLARENPGQTLQATALVHEAFLRLVHSETAVEWDHRGHFFAAAAEAMRRILVENARRKRAERNGGGLDRREIEMEFLSVPPPSEDLLALDEALTRLEAADPVKAKLVHLRYFGGLTIDEAAKVLGVSPATAKRYWTFSKAWLYREIEGSRN